MTSDDNSPAAQNTARILVVDDEASLRELIRRGLAKMGYSNVTAVQSGAEAFSALRIDPISGPANGLMANMPFDLVLLDIMLPDIAGYQVCKRIKQVYHRHLPVVLMTGYNIEDSEMRFLDAGADDFITKPFQLGELTTRIKSVLRRVQQMMAETSTQGLTVSSSWAGLCGGERVGAYSVETVISWGGGNVLCKVRKPPDDTLYMLKLLLPHAAQQEEVFRRFEKEAELLALFDHPNIVRFIDRGARRGCPYYIMEYIAAENLDSRLLMCGPFTVQDVLYVGEGIAKGLKHLHGEGIFHRDVSLRNIIWDDVSGAVKIVDLGIARRAGEVSLTQDGRCVGTPFYMAPEMFAGEDVTPATDIYSLGVCLYHLLAGKPPFVADNTVELARKHLYEEPEPISTVRSDVPAQWDDVLVGGCLAKKPDQRYKSMTDLLAGIADLRQTLC